jgi:hypothetical protein
MSGHVLTNPQDQSASVNTANPSPAPARGAARENPVARHSSLDGDVELRKRRARCARPLANLHAFSRAERTVASNVEGASGERVAGFIPTRSTRSPQPECVPTFPTRPLDKLGETFGNPSINNQTFSRAERTNVSGVEGAGRKRLRELASSHFAQANYFEFSRHETFYA